MSEEEENINAPVSGEADVAEENIEEQSRMVPLAALEAERRKRQDVEMRNRFLEEQRNNKPEPIEEEDDSTELVEKGYLKEYSQANKREILEQLYLDMNPKAEKEIEENLRQILELRPWLKDSIEHSPNRYARAYQVIQDYKHLIGNQKQSAERVQDVEKLIENSRKPRSPMESGKSAQHSQMDFLKSIQGKKEFREYRDKVRRGEV